MNVGVAAPGYGLGRSGGVQVYVRELVRALGAHDVSDTAYTLLLRPEDEAGALPPRLRVARLAQLSAPAPAWRRTTRLLFGVARELDGLGFDVVHCPATRLIEPRPRAPVVLTFFDMQEEFLPALFPWRARWARRLLHRHAVGQARVVIAPSAFTRDSLRQRYGTPEAKLRVVPAGVGEALFAARAPDESALLGARFGLPAGEYLLYPAHPWPHKNHALLLRALAALGQRRGGAPLLVCTGRLAGEAPRLPALAAAAGLPAERVRDLGFVAEADLPLLLRGARLLAFPSLFEGFGLPVAEALAAGCPVLCSDIPPLREIAAGVARLIDPHSARAWSEALGALWDEPHERARLAHAGRARAEAFRWRGLVPQIVAAYRAAARVTSRAG